MEVVIVNQRQVYELLPMRECIDVMAEVLRDLTGGGCILPLRQIMWLKEKVSALGLMPAYWERGGRHRAQCGSAHSGFRCKRDGDTPSCLLDVPRSAAIAAAHFGPGRCTCGAGRRRMAHLAVEEERVALAAAIRCSKSSGSGAAGPLSNYSMVETESRGVEIGELRVKSSEFK
ncbi:MAG: hypothetical protein IID33_11985, partial [Planctomycetes bacterium]|nr:hypothetical protein [Planctomycetota bacterium]